MGEARQAGVRAPGRAKKLAADRRPLLFGVVQGGRDLDLRRKCAEGLLELGVDGIGFGGWPIDSEGQLLLDLVAFTRELVPAELPFHALGIGHPENLVACAAVGCDLFDSALVTRDARRGRLYTFAGDAPACASELRPGWFEFLYLQDKIHIKDSRPICADCPCACCAAYSRGYLHHLLKIEDNLYPRLATIHNLTFMQRLTRLLRNQRQPQALEPPVHPS